MEENKKSVWEVLSAIDCSDKVEKKGNLTYLSWAWAWGIVRKNYPTANYCVREWDGVPFFEHPTMGVMVETSVTINGETITMRLPVMDNRNRTIETKNVRMFDINTAIMRCLTKNLAMFGLGHYIYAGEDIPDAVAEQEDECVDLALPNIANREELDNYWKSLTPRQRADKVTLDKFKKRAGELKETISK